MSVSYILNMTSTWNELVTNSGNPNNTSSDAGSMSLQKTYGDGTGSGLVNSQFHEYRSLASGESRNYDLRAVTGSLLGNTITKTFSKVKIVEFKNYNTASGNNIAIDVTSASGFKSAFGSPTGNIVLGSYGHYGINDLYGWPVNANSCQILVTNNHTGPVAYEINLGGEL